MEGHTGECTVTTQLDSLERTLSIGSTQLHSHAHTHIHKHTLSINRLHPGESVEKMILQAVPRIISQVPVGGNWIQQQTEKLPVILYCTFQTLKAALDFPWRVYRACSTSRSGDEIYGLHNEREIKSICNTVTSYCTVLWVPSVVSWKKKKTPKLHSQKCWHYLGFSVVALLQWYHLNSLVLTKNTANCMKPLY